MILFRQTGPGHPFTWESAEQPAARWHALGEGPVHYFATTPDGAWAEFLRHEEITDPDEIDGLRARAVWAVRHDLPDLPRPQLPAEVLTGGLESYAACRDEARRLRANGAEGLRTLSAALPERGARLFGVDGGQVEDEAKSEVVVLFGPRPDLWAMLCALGKPDRGLVERINPLS